MFALRKHGSVAEWLGRGLQNLVQRFESARYLQLPGPDLHKKVRAFFFPGIFLFAVLPGSIRIFTFSLKKAFLQVGILYDFHSFCLSGSFFLNPFEGPTVREPPLDIYSFGFFIVLI
jgi:hypothetical protein